MFFFPFVVPKKKRWRDEERKDEFTLRIRPFSGPLLQKNGAQPEERLK